MALSQRLSATQLYRWRAGPPDDVIAHDFGDGVAVYHRPSGKTHLLNEASYRLLDKLLKEPKDVAIIAAAFSPGADGLSQEKYLERLAQMLLRLEQFGLTERV